MEQEQAAIFRRLFQQDRQILHLWLACVLVGLDEDLADADIFANSPQSGLHGLPGPEDGHASDLRDGTPPLDKNGNIQNENDSWTAVARPYPLPMEGPAFIVLPLRGLDHVHLLRDVSIKKSKTVN